MQVSCLCSCSFYIATTSDINTTAMAEEEEKEIWAIWEAVIGEKYESYDPSTYESKLQKKCIYKWPNDLALTSSMSKHRTPYMVSLGPYHHGKKNLQPMEHHKQRALYRILNRSGVSLTSFIESLKGIEQELRDSYDNLDPKLSSDIYRKCLITRITTEQQRRQPCLHVIRKGLKQMPFAVRNLVFRLLGKQISKPGNVRSAVRFNEAGVEFRTAELFSGLQMNFDMESGVLSLFHTSVSCLCGCSFCMATMRDINTTAMAEEKKKDKEIWPIWVIDIEKEYKSYDPDEYESKLEKKCIYRWPNSLAITSSMSKHRTPHMASLGPYHHGKQHLQPMEHHKKRAKWEAHMTVALRDMLLLENQIPLLVLRKLVEVGKLCEVNSDAYLNQLITRIYRLSQIVASNNFRISEIYLELISELISQILGLNQMDGSSLHILDIYRNCLIRGITTEQQRTPDEEGFIKSVCMHCQPWLHVIGKGLKQMPFAVPILVFRFLGKQISKPGNVRSAMRFHEAGVEFKKAEPCSGLKITFDQEHGVLTLPFILIEDRTAAIYMNLMAFERMHPNIQKHEVTSYVVFMDSLIDTAEDVSLLCSQGIVRNLLGSDEDAANVFNKLGDGIAYSPDDELHWQLQSYVASDWNAARAYLKRNYFHNPWSIMSLLAAIALLVLTFIQTLFTVLAEAKGK
ncbi:uncharacterized protein LOC116250119 [Nymphaea colorata]|nr:uncharacterized protein LOC116250119 [Nymphaea colorata]